MYRSSIPTPPIPLFTLRRAPRGAQRKTRGRVDRYSFLVRNFHSLLHAGLARRTVIRIFRQPTVERVVKSPVFDRADGRIAVTHHIAQRFVVILLLVISTWW